MVCISLLFVFFFKQKTAYEMRISDWSSDVCSSDLQGVPMENWLNLAGKNAFVTGASSGLGAHFAKILARAGANVVIAARRRESLDAVAADIAAAVGACRAIALDISSADSIAAAASEIEAADILVNNAGIARDAPFLDHLESDWDDVLATNVKGMFLATQMAARGMKRRGRGSIVHIASIPGLQQAGRIVSISIGRQPLRT